MCMFSEAVRLVVGSANQRKCVNTTANAGSAGLVQRGRMPEKHP